MRVLVVVAAILIVAVAAVRQPTLPSSYVAHSHASPARLQRDVITLTSIARCADDPSSLDRAASYIEQQFRATGARVSVQTYTARRHTYRTRTHHARQRQRHRRPSGARPPVPKKGGSSVE